MWNELNPVRNDRQALGARPGEDGVLPPDAEREGPQGGQPCGAAPEREQGTPPRARGGEPESENAPRDGERTDSGTGVEPEEETVAEAETPRTLPRLTGRRQRGRRLVQPEAVKSPPNTPTQRLLILDCWQRSGLPARDFADLVGVSAHTRYAWKKAFALHGPTGLMEQPRGVKQGSRLPELTKRTVLMLKEQHPDWGCERISGMLLRGPALPASPSAVARVLHEAGYELPETPTRPHPDQVRFFERARPHQLWQTDLFTFLLKRQNRRVYLVAFLDDHSRFLVSFGLQLLPGAPPVPAK